MNPADQSGTRPPAGNLETALARARVLLVSNPKLAIEQAGEILKVVPGNPEAQGVLADAWRALGDHYSLLGEAAAADAAYALGIKASTRDPRLLAPAAALCDGRIAVAEQLLKQHLKRAPTDVAAIRMLAEVAGRLRRNADAEKLLARCLELAPGFAAARQNYALILHRQNKPEAALGQLDVLLQRDPRNPSLRNLKAAVLGTVGEYAAALELYAGIVAEYPNQPKIWLSYGHALKTAGRQEDSIAAYRKTIELAPGLGEAWWSLANLKTFRFTADEMLRMRAQLEQPGLTEEDRFHFEFTLGKAEEDDRNYAASFAHYAEANRLRRSAVRYDADDTSTHVRRSKALFTPEFLASRAGEGAAAPAAPKGAKLPVTPDFKANLTGRYEFELAQLDAHFQVGLVYVGDRQTDLRTFENQIVGELPAYTLTNISFGAGTGDWALEFFLTNAFNEYAEFSRYTECAEARCGPQAYSVVAPPRTFGIKFSQEF